MTIPPFFFFVLLWFVLFVWFGADLGWEEMDRNRMHYVKNLKEIAEVKNEEFVTF